MSDSKRVVAIDVAALPQADLERVVHAANARLVADGDSFAFSDTRKAHMTLLQTYVEEDKLQEVYRITEEVIRKTLAESAHSRSLRITGTSVGPVFDGSYLPSFDVANEGLINEIHTALVNALEPLRVLPRSDGVHKGLYSSPVDLGSEDVEAAQHCFYPVSDEAKERRAGPSSVRYVANFTVNSSFNKYKPHITLGSCVESKSEVLKSSELHPEQELYMSLGRFAIYQLGDFCTCRKLLFEIDL